MGKPFVLLALGPQLFESAEHPSFAIPLERLPRWLNRLSWTSSRRRG